MFLDFLDCKKNAMEMVLFIVVLIVIGHWYLQSSYQYPIQLLYQALEEIVGP